MIRRASIALAAALALAACEQISGVTDRGVAGVYTIQTIDGLAPTRTNNQLGVESGSFTLDSVSRVRVEFCRDTDSSQCTTFRDEGTYEVVGDSLRFTLPGDRTFSGTRRGDVLTVRGFLGNAVVLKR